MWRFGLSLSLFKDHSAGCNLSDLSIRDKASFRIRVQEASNLVRLFLFFCTFHIPFTRGIANVDVAVLA